ncbi:MAG: hypothetical protein DRQ40_03565 [Gammaproteobacteria bacterium]|nr:MAG: hypothetical protein DRQ40_03565 [Gammaproteobacteria bacterium]
MNVAEFKGLANKRDPLMQGPSYLSNAVNVDVDDTSSIRRRVGSALAFSFNHITASYSLRNKSDAYIIADENLILMSDQSVKISDMPTGHYVFDDFEDNVFVYGPRKIRLQSGKAVDWDIPVCPQPLVRVILGDQPAGIYQITAVYRNANGLEGSTSTPIVVQAGVNSALSIEVTQISNYTVTIYISPPNGKYMYQWMNTNIPNNVWNGSITGLVSPLNPDQLGTTTVPDNCQCIAYHQSKMYLSQFIPAENKTVVWFSKPFSYHLFDQAKDYFVVEGEIKALVDVTKAIVIGTATSIYYYVDGELDKVAYYGVPEGKSFDRNDDGKVWMYTNKGICLLNEFANLTEVVYNFPISAKVSSAVIEQDGFERMINLLSDSNPAPNTFGS